MNDHIFRLSIFYLWIITLVAGLFTFLHLLIDGVSQEHVTNAASEYFRRIIPQIAIMLAFFFSPAGELATWGQERTRAGLAAVISLLYHVIIWVLLFVFFVMQIKGQSISTASTQFSYFLDTISVIGFTPVVYLFASSVTRTRRSTT